MPPKASKRLQTESSAEPTPTNEGNKKPRLDLQEQIKRASALAAQLRDGVKDDADSKNSAANQIATEELMRIFESMQKETVDTSKSVKDLVAAQIVWEVKSTLEFLEKSIKDNSKNNGTKYFYTGLELLLKPGDPKYSASVIRAAQEKMKDVTSENYVVEIKKIVKEVIVDDYMKAYGNTLHGVLSAHK
ncbi:hypothetical protein KCU60_g8630, partial [Aureobasidium melanogenum]